MNIELNQIYNIDCLKGLDLMIEQGVFVDTVLTSPPYNTMRNSQDDVGYDLYEFADLKINSLSLNTKLLNLVKLPTKTLLKT